MKLMSLFDGSGGFPLAASLCGIEPVYAAEVEPYPIAVTKNRFPKMKHLGDVSKVKGGEIEPVDIITFGSPCQDMSIAGKRAGLKHADMGDDETTRSGLFLEAIRIIKEMREATNGVYPRYAIWENVPGAFSSNRGEDFRTVLEEFIRVKEKDAVMPAVPQAGWAYADCISGDGWSIAYRVFDAQYWGVPQRRRRIYLVADFRGECAQEILFKRESLRGYFEAGRTPWQGIAADAQNCVGTAIGGVDRYNQSFLPGLAQTLRAPGGGDCTPTVLAPVAVYCHQGNGIDRAGKCLTAYSFDSLSSNSMKSKNPHSGCRAVEIAKTLDTGYPDPSKNQGGIAIVEKIILDDQGGQQISVCTDGKSPTLRAEAHGNAPYVINKKTLVYDTRGNGAGETVPTITGDHNNRVTDYTCLAITRCYDIGEARLRTPSEYIEKSPTITARCGTGGNNVPGVVYCLQGNGIDRADTAGCNGKGWKEDTSYTLNTIDKPAVVCAQKSYTEFKDESTLSTLKATGGSYGGGSENIVVKNYIVRRLTPTECARLQGFPSWWGIVNPVENLTDEDYAFWLDVRNTYAEINGKATKEYTREQMLAWYNKLHSDSAEYKMWGNGIALPNALYVMQGIAAEAEIPINLF
ncbi:DNA cytosine methyltransferase [Phascolarctobacterium faecium]|jgi:DNA (cytosine-5)-methyltransferase 1